MDFSHLKCKSGGVYRNGVGMNVLQPSSQPTFSLMPLGFWHNMYGMVNKPLEEKKERENYFETNGFFGEKKWFLL